jgi:hypothetical protein
MFVSAPACNTNYYSFSILINILLLAENGQ